MVHFTADKLDLEVITQSLDGVDHSIEERSGVRVSRRFDLRSRVFVFDTSFLVELPDLLDERERVNSNFQGFVGVTVLSQPIPSQRCEDLVNL